MDLLQVKGNQIVDSQGRSVILRGVCVGGWMNMEDFINGLLKFLLKIIIKLNFNEVHLRHQLIGVVNMVIAMLRKYSVTLPICKGWRGLINIFLRES